MITRHFVLVILKNYFLNILVHANKIGVNSSISNAYFFHVYYP